MLPLNLTADVLLLAFASGVLLSAGRNRALRVTAGLLVGNAVMASVAIAFFPMHLGEAVSTFANTMNVVLMAASVLFFLLAMGFGAAAYRNGFRFYSIGTLLTYPILGIWGAFGAPRVPSAPHPSLVGVQERTMMYGYLLWVVVLSIVLLRKGVTAHSNLPST